MQWPTPEQMRALCPLPQGDSIAAMTRGDIELLVAGGHACSERAANPSASCRAATEQRRRPGGGVRRVDEAGDAKRPASAQGFLWPEDLCMTPQCEQAVAARGKG